MYLVGKTLLGTLSSITGADLPIITSQYEWKVEIYKSDGGLKKYFYLGQYNCPIIKLDYEMNKKLCGAGTIEFAYLDFPIDMADYILVYFWGDLKYRGKVENVCDKKGGVVKLTSYNERFDNIITFNNYTDKTIEYILNDLIVNGQPNEPKVKWNDSTVSFNDTDLYSFNYSDGKSLKECINELVGLLEDTEWGVDQYNYFYVYETNTNLNQIFYNNYTPLYSEIEIDKDYSKIDATRYEVYRKISGTNETNYVGQVGGITDGITIEAEIGEQRIKKYIVSDVVTSDAEAESIALANLKANCITPLSVNIKNVNLDFYYPTINHRVRVQDKIEYILQDLIFCNLLINDDATLNNIGNWSNNVSIDNTYYVNTSSIKWILSNTTNDYIYYNFNEIKHFKDLKKISFMIYATNVIYNMKINIYSFVDGWSTGTWADYEDRAWSKNSTSVIVESFKFNLEQVNTWSYQEFYVTMQNIAKIEIISENNNYGSTIYLDRFQMFLPSSEIVEANIIKYNVNISNSGYSCNMQLNDYDKFANDNDFKNKKRLDKLEAINNA